VKTFHRLRHGTKRSISDSQPGVRRGARQKINKKTTVENWRAENPDRSLRVRASNLLRTMCSKKRPTLCS